MLSKNLENSTSYDIFYKFWKKARVYYTLSISRGGGPGPRAPPPGFATGLPLPLVVTLFDMLADALSSDSNSVHTHAA